jgi:hypothetical protein
MQRLARRNVVGNSEHQQAVIHPHDLQRPGPSSANSQEAAAFQLSTAKNAEPAGKL